MKLAVIVALVPLTPFCFAFGINLVLYVALQRPSDQNEEYGTLRTGGGYFWVQKNASTSSHEDARRASSGLCDPFGETGVWLDESSQCLNIALGGQPVYLDSRGALRFARPYENTLPAGSSASGFTYDRKLSSLRFKGNPFFYLCRYTGPDEDGGQVAYKVVAASSGKSCVHGTPVSVKAKDIAAQCRASVS